MNRHYFIIETNPARYLQQMYVGFWMSSVIPLFVTSQFSDGE